METKCRAVINNAKLLGLLLGIIHVSTSYIPAQAQEIEEQAALALRRHGKQKLKQSMHGP